MAWPKTKPERLAHRTATSMTANQHDIAIAYLTRYTSMNCAGSHSAKHLQPYPHNKVTHTHQSSRSNRGKKADLQDAGVAVLLVLRRLSEVEGAGDVGRAAVILPPTVHQQHARLVDRLARLLLRPTRLTLVSAPIKLTAPAWA